MRAEDRAGLERFCHYLLRPPLAQERLKTLPDGRVCCTLVGRRIVMLHSFVKKSERTPVREREIAEARMKEIKRANA